MTREDDGSLTALPGGQRDRCGRCDEVIVASPHVIGTWVAARPAPKIGERGQRPGLCPDGEPHRPGRQAGDGEVQPLRRTGGHL